MACNGSAIDFPCVGALEPNIAFGGQSLEIQREVWILYPRIVPICNICILPGILGRCLLWKETIPLFDWDPFGYVWKWCIPRNHQFSWGKFGKMVINLWNGRCPSFQQTHLYIGVLFFCRVTRSLGPISHIRHTSRGSNKGSWGAYCGRDGKTGWLPSGKLT